MTAVVRKQVTRTITLAGANLFQVALQELGDATQWNRIAALNGIIPPDYILTGVVTLKIPPKGPGNGGVLTF